MRFDTIKSNQIDLNYSSIETYTHHTQATLDIFPPNTHDFTTYNRHEHMKKKMMNTAN